MALSSRAKLNNKTNLNKSGLYVEDAMKLDVVNVVHQEENIYLDVFLYNESNKVKRASYRKTQNTVLLDSPSDYKCYLQKFQLRTGRIPMFVNKEYDLSIGLYYYPDNLVSIKTALKTLYTPTYLFYSEYVVLNNPDGINPNIKDAFDDIVAQYEVIHGAGSWIVDNNPLNPPFIAYNVETGFFEVYNDVDSSDNNTKAVQLYISEDVYTLIGGLALDYPPINAYGTNSTTLIPPSYAKVTFSIGPANNNVVTINSDDYVRIIQAYRTLSRWWTVKNILITTDTVGIRSHYVAGTSQNPDTVYRNILQSIQLNYDDRGGNPPGWWVEFVPTGDFTYVDVLSDSPLKNISFELLYNDIFGGIYEVNLDPKDSFSLTVGFVKRLI